MPILIITEDAQDLIGPGLLFSPQHDEHCKPFRWARFCLTTYGFEPDLAMNAQQRRLANSKRESR